MLLDDCEVVDTCTDIDQITILFTLSLPPPPGTITGGVRHFMLLFPPPSKDVQFGQKLQNRELWRALLNSMEWVRPQLYCVEIYFLSFLSLLLIQSNIESLFNSSVLTV